jgi:hypothetical protein
VGRRALKTAKRAENSKGKKEPFAFQNGKRKVSSSKKGRVFALNRRPGGSHHQLPPLTELYFRS